MWNIRTKLILIITLTNSVSLLIAAGMAFLYGRMEYRDAMTTGLMADARFIGYNSAAAIEFDDPEDATEGLRALRINENIIAAAISTETSPLFATYLRKDANIELFQTLTPEQGAQFIGDKLFISEYILQDGKRIGMVHLISDLNDFEAWARRNALVGGAVLFCIALLALLLSIRLQRLISTPILELASTAKRISENKDYSIRATRHADDELGLLSEQFNEMLRQIEDQDDALREANEQLEERVQARTEDLQIALEGAEAASRAKGDFLANMSHELRTPLNGIVGMMGLLSASELTNEQREQVGVVVQSANSLAAIVNDILDFSKIEAGKFDLESRPFKLDDIVHSTSELLSVSAANKGVDLFTHFDASAPTQVMGDPGRVRQILTNILGNAVKFTPSGRILVRVTHTQRARASLQFNFSVEDTGIGIPADKVHSIFENFTQADASMTRKYGGTGLGLAITRRLVEMMDGTIRIESDYGQGTTVTFSLCLDRAPSTDSEDIGFSAQGRRVLLYDDDAVTSHAYTENLTAWGFEVDIFTEADEAIAALQLDATDQEGYQLLLINAASPAIDPLQFARDVRAFTNLATLQLIAIGSPTRNCDTRAYSEAGIDQYVGSYITPSRLLDAVVTQLQGEVTGTRRDDGPKKATAAHSSLAAEGRKHHEILLVEDNLVNQTVALGILNRMGLDAAIAEDGLQAVEAVRARKFDIILMDVQMPVMDGFTATREIRKIEGNGRVPIVAMTANAMSGDRERCLDAGMDSYVAKPIDVDILREVLAQHLGNHAVRGTRIESFLIVAYEEPALTEIMAAVEVRWPNASIHPASTAVAACIQIGSRLPQCVLFHEGVTDIDATALIEFLQSEKRYKNTHLVRWCERQPIDESAEVPTLVGTRDLDTLEAILTGNYILPSPASDQVSHGANEEIEPVFSREIALGFCGGREASLLTLMTLALNDLPAQRDALKEAIASVDADAIERGFHTLKGQAAYLGAGQLKNLALEAEKTARAGNIDDAIAFLPAIEEATATLCDTLRAALSGKAPSSETHG